MTRVERKLVFTEMFLERQEINQDFINSDQIKQFQQKSAQAYKKTYTLPSVGEKAASGTYRLHFKRRHTVERTNLIIIRASNLLM